MLTFIYLTGPYAIRHSDTLVSSPQLMTTMRSHRLLHKGNSGVCVGWCSWTIDLLLDECVRLLKGSTSVHLEDIKYQNTGMLYAPNIVIITRDLDYCCSQNESTEDCHPFKPPFCLPPSVMHDDVIDFFPRVYLTSFQCVDLPNSRNVFSLNVFV